MNFQTETDRDLKWTSVSDTLRGEWKQAGQLLARKAALVRAEPSSLSSVPHFCATGTEVMMQMAWQEQLPMAHC